MPTSHFCNGKWKEGPVSSCPKHAKLSKRQTTVYRGIGEPGGRQGDSKPSDTASSSPPADSSSSAAASSD